MDPLLQVVGKKINYREKENGFMEIKGFILENLKMIKNTGKEF